VAVPISTTHKFISWESFVGLKGVMSTGYVLDQKTNEFINSYLHVTNKGYLLPDLQAVKYGDYQYIVGSDLQLTYAIKNNDLSQDLIVMKNLHKDINVYMAFAKGSPCKSYAIYMQKRLQDYKNNGTLEKIVQQYLY
jgi:ABC-type amino acid transport substrate-binding protein